MIARNMQNVKNGIRAQVPESGHSILKIVSPHEDVFLRLIEAVE